MDYLRLFYTSTLPWLAPVMVPEMKLPGKRDFAPSDEKISDRTWNDIYTGSILLNFTESSFAMKHAGKLHNVTYQEILDKDGKFQRAFATIENPQKPGEYRLFEMPYQHFDGDKVDGKPAIDSTGFKMCMAVEHKLPHTTKAEADKIIQNLTVLPSQPRDLVKNADGKTKVSMDFGGWNFEVGGGFNAYQIEHGGLPLQWKNIIGIEGKSKAMEEGMDALKKIGVDVRGGKTEVNFVSNSMGGFPAQMAKYKLEKDYGIKSTWDNIVHMGFGNTVKQLTELQWNLEHNSTTLTYQSLDQIGKTQTGRDEAVAIANKLGDPENTRTVITTNNYFANYNINGNEHNCTPALPGSKVILMATPDNGIPLIPRDSFIDHGERIRHDHLITPLNKVLADGPACLSYATYKPYYNEEVLLFGEKKHTAPLVEEEVVGILHKGLLRAPDRLKNGVAGDGNFADKLYTTVAGTERFPLEKNELYGIMHAEQAVRERAQSAETNKTSQQAAPPAPIPPTLLQQLQSSGLSAPPR